jgi:hypothetical protein
VYPWPPPQSFIVLMPSMRWWPLAWFPFTMRDLCLAGLSLGPHEAETSPCRWPLLWNIWMYITDFNHSGGSSELAHDGDSLIWESVWPLDCIPNTHATQRGYGPSRLQARSWLLWAQWPEVISNLFLFPVSIQTLEFHINSNIVPKFRKPILLGFYIQDLYKKKYETKQ